MSEQIHDTPAMVAKLTQRVAELEELHQAFRQTLQERDNTIEELNKRIAELEGERGTDP